MNSMRICNQLWGTTMTVAASIAQRLTSCKVNPSNFGRCEAHLQRHQNNSMPSSAVSTASTLRVLAADVRPSICRNCRCTSRSRSIV